MTMIAMPNGPRQASAKRAKPAWALAIELRRTSLQLSQEVIAERADMSQSYYSEIERGTKEPRSLTLEKLLGLARALRWSMAEMQEKTGLELGAEPRVAYDLQPFGGARLLLHGGDVGAGMSPRSNANDYQQRRYMPSHPAIEGYDDDDLMTLDVVGDSMACDIVRQTIPENSTVYLHTRLEPQVGDIIAVWLERQQCGVLKIYRTEGKRIVLESYNEAHEPIILSDNDADILQGVYLGHLSMGRRSLNTKPRMRR